MSFDKQKRKRLPGIAAYEPAVSTFAQSVKFYAASLSKTHTKYNKQLDSSAIDNLEAGTVS